MKLGTLFQTAALLLSATLVLAGCQGASPSNGATAGVVTKAGVSDLRTEAMQALYTGQRTPDDFYREPVQAVSTSVYHLKSTDLANSSDVGRHDVCTDSVSEAYGWIEQYMGGDTRFALLDSSETAMYFQETYQSYASSPTVDRQIRVFKCSYADRSVYDWNNPGTALAILHADDSNGAALEGLAEYLWYFSPNNNTGNAVLDDSLQQVNGQWVFQMTEVYSQTNWTGGCDAAMVFSTTYQVDPLTGEVDVDRTLIDSFTWQHDGGSYQQCSG